MFNSARKPRQPNAVDFSSGFSNALRIVLFTAALSAGVAHADDYADVNRLVRAGQLAEALTKADQYLAGKPRDPQMRFIKGVIQTEAGKPADAISTFTKITEDYPELPEPYNNLAVLYAGQSQFDKARAALEMAIRTNPSYATAHENLGDVYAKLASQAYSKALQLDGGNAAVQPKLALIRTLFSAEQKAGVGASASRSAPVAAGAASTPRPAPVIVAAASAPKPAPVIVAAASVPKPAPVVVAAAPAPVPAVKLGPAATPAAPAPIAAAAPAAAVANGADKQVETAVRAWADAWASKDMGTYLGSYAQNFDPAGQQSRQSWEADRRARIVGKSSISVKLSNLAIAVNGSKATAKFKQDYSADSLNVSSRKTLDMAKVGERWVIVKESTGN